jgi:putative ABC transport system ATP-binding protein
MGDSAPLMPLKAAAGGVAVSVRGLNHAYRSRRGSLTVLRGVNLEIAPGAYVALTGPSGAGKTTLLSILGGLEPATEGEVKVGDFTVNQLRGERLAKFRRETVGFVFQHFGLLGALTALENVELALALSGSGKRAREQRAMDLLAAVGLSQRAHHLPKALSGGERQRVAMARAMANEPRLLLADEPTGNLDPDAGLAVMELLERLRLASGSTVLVVSHNPLVAGRAEVRYRLENGMLVQPT